MSKCAALSTLDTLDTLVAYLDTPVRTSKESVFISIEWEYLISIHRILAVFCKTYS